MHTVYWIENKHPSAVALLKQHVLDGAYISTIAVEAWDVNAYIGRLDLDIRLLAINTDWNMF